MMYKVYSLIKGYWSLWVSAPRLAAGGVLGIPGILDGDSAETPISLKIKEYTLNHIRGPTII